jgi:hypothetical protein
VSSRFCGRKRRGKVAFDVPEIFVLGGYVLEVSL